MFWSRKITIFYCNEKIFFEEVTFEIGNRGNALA